MTDLTYDEMDLYETEIDIDSFNFPIIFSAPILKIFICDKNDSYLDFIQYNVSLSSLVAPTQTIEREFQKKIYDLLPHIKKSTFLSFIKERGL